MRKKRDLVLLVLLLVSLGVFAFVAWKLINIYWEYHQGAETYEELQEYVQVPEENKDTPEDDPLREEPKSSENAYLQVDLKD